MGLTRIGAVAAAFGRDLDFDLQRIDALIDHARRDGVHLLVLPDAALGGYLSDVHTAEPDSLPPALAIDDAHIARIAASAAAMTVCFGFREADGGRYYNTAVCVSGDGVLGVHRKVHQPVHEQGAYSPGDRFAAFDTPVGRLGMLIDYDKTFPESARSLALDGAEILACLSAWPTSITNRAARMRDDRQSRLFDLYDQARAAENQVVLASANLTGSLGGLRFLGQAKVVGPGGDIRARTWSKAGLVTTELDVAAEIDTARKVLDHLAERRPELYR
ncbi:carbon-nitrogen hydrolase family protein [Glycomyces sp. NPDC049804]|uniref:carbon-nitrogen hydrolase family protein n=1 Tax=Glycomyces sp. NPDC049804 TaxID=3154363 RepID=UPI003430DC55